MLPAFMLFDMFYSLRPGLFVPRPARADRRARGQAGGRVGRPAGNRAPSTCGSWASRGRSASTGRMTLGSTRAAEPFSERGRTERSSARVLFSSPRPRRRASDSRRTASTSLSSRFAGFGESTAAGSPASPLQVRSSASITITWTVVRDMPCSLPSRPPRRPRPGASLESGSWKCPAVARTTRS
jgi:hypothetical protein